MPVMLELGEDMGELVFSFRFWVPPTQYTEWVSKARGKIQMLSHIFSNKRPRHARGGIVYSPQKNIAEQANIRQCFLREVERLDIGYHLPWSEGKTGVRFFGYDPPPKHWWPGMMHIKKPDCTNIMKQLEDALNPDWDHGFPGAWPDDTMVVPLAPDKFYANPGQATGVWCEIYWFRNIIGMNRPATPRKQKAKNVTTV